MEAKRDIQFTFPKKQPFKVQGKLTRVGDNQSEINTMAYDPEGKFIAVGCYDGSIKIYSPFTGKLHTTLVQQSGIPITSIRWRPQFSGKNVRASTVLIATTSDGLIQWYHMGTNKMINEITTHRDTGNNLCCSDYTRDGVSLLVAGQNRNVYVYDEKTLQIKAIMNDRHYKIPGHQNRIFSVKCHPEDVNIVASAGWDRSIKIYDIRDKAPICTIGGSEVTGDSLDIFDDMIVCGSHRNKDVMQVYSIHHQQLVHTFKYNQSPGFDSDAGYVFSSRFSSDGNLIFAGGAGKNELKVFMNNADTSANFKLQAEALNLPAPVFCIDKSPIEKQFAFGLSNGQVQICNYEIDSNSVEFEPYTGEFINYTTEKNEKERQADLAAKKAKRDAMTDSNMEPSNSVRTLN